MREKSATGAILDFRILNIFLFSTTQIERLESARTPLCRNHTLTMSYSALLFKRSEFYLYKNPQKNERKDKSNQMRNVIFAINTTLDGFCDHTKFNPDEETLN